MGAALVFYSAGWTAGLFLLELLNPRSQRRTAPHRLWLSLNKRRLFWTLARALTQVCSESTECGEFLDDPALFFRCPRRQAAAR
jgi:hypothetical protein